MRKRAEIPSLHVNNGTLLFFQHCSQQKGLISSTFKVSRGEYIAQIDRPFDNERTTYSKLVLNVRCPTCFREHCNGMICKHCRVLTSRCDRWTDTRTDAAYSLGQPITSDGGQKGHTKVNVEPVRDFDVENTPGEA